MINISFASFISFFTDLLDPNKLGKLLDNLSPWQYVVLFLVIFAESGLLIGIFLPGDTLLFTAGVLAVDGKLNIWILVPLFFIAAFSGDQTGYLVGNKLGEKLFKKENAKILKKSHIEKTHAFFEKHGPKTILLARFVPIVRTIAPTMAGTARMSYKTFVKYNAVGAALWGVGVSLLGFFLGSAIGKENIEKYLILIVAIIFIISFIPPAIEFIKHKKESKEAREELKDLADTEL